MVTAPWPEVFARKPTKADGNSEDKEKGVVIPEAEIRSIEREAEKPDSRKQKGKEKSENDEVKEAESGERDKERGSETECDGDSESDEKQRDIELPKNNERPEGQETLPRKGRDQDQPAKKSCDYVITRKRQIELNGITSMHQVYGKRIFKCELTCLRYLRIFKEQARKEDEEQRSASQEKKKRDNKRD